MPVSQFDRAKSFTAPASRGEPLIHVGGPLTDLRAADRPSTIEFVIIQNPPDPEDPSKKDHDPAHAIRVRGSVKPTGNDRWDAIVPAGDLEIGDEARGIGVAVIEQIDGYAYEALTWCDHIKAIEATTAADVEQDLADLNASPAVQEDLAQLAASSVS
jgi:hypothetical protein